jgi:UPF0489 domain
LVGVLKDLLVDMSYKTLIATKQFSGGKDRHRIRIRMESEKIPLVVVESHHHALEHIHDVLRWQYRRHRGGSGRTAPGSVPDCARTSVSRPLQDACLFSKGWSMWHWDAHPDLSCPDPIVVPALSCYQPRRLWTQNPRLVASKGQQNLEGVHQGASSSGKDLYELLDSTNSGIAEWILPLVLSGELTRVEWVRPAYASDDNVHASVAPGPSRVCINNAVLPDGNHLYHVGAWVPPIKDADRQASASNQIASNGLSSCMDLPDEAVVKVDWDIPYYTDDDCFVPLEQLHLPRSLNLTVNSALDRTATSNSRNGNVAVNEMDQRDDEQPRPPWLFDICLDFFICDNPFVKDLEKVSSEFAQALVAALHESKSYQASTSHPMYPHSGDAASRRRTRQELAGRLEHLLNVILQSDCEGTEIHAPLETRVPDKVDYLDVFGDPSNDLLSCYDSAELGIDLIGRLDRAVTSHSTDIRELKTLIQMGIEALPNLCMPHGNYSHPASSNEVWTSVDRHLVEFTEALAKGFHHPPRTVNRELGKDDDPPFMVTVARSAVDGFTPWRIADDLQAKILQIVHDRYCACGRQGLHPVSVEIGSQSSADCRFHVLFDFGEWEGATLGLVHT